MQFAKNLARNRLKAAAQITDESEYKQEARWALESESRHRLRAMLELAQSEAPISDTGENWDRDPWLLGVANGVLDLRTGVLRRGKLNDRVTMHTNIAFDPHAAAPLWLKTLHDIFEGRPEVVDYFQRCVGYWLTGSTREQCIFNLWGSGANGKSLVLEVLRYVFGPYALAAPFSMFEKKNKASIPSDLASSAGKRLLTASETDESTRLNESRIKSMTGSDKQTARFLYKDWFEFESTAKIVLAFNHKPEINDSSDGMRRRIRLIPFNRKFAPHEQDRMLKEKLQQEAAGILAWAVRGSMEWQKRGLDEPQAIIEATEEYRREIDTFGNFISERCELDGNHITSFSELRKSYEDWATENGLSVLDQKTFVRRLRSLGLTPTKMDHGYARGWRGIGLKEAHGNDLSNLTP